MTRVRTYRSISAAAIAVALLAMPRPAAATHYPAGSICYDCHAVSKGKMVPGTHLIKASQKTVDLGIDQSSVAGGMRCLFCHSKNASSAALTATRVMRPVEDHFNASSLSKHGEWETAATSIKQSNPVQNSGLFDCLDCHTGHGGGVTAGGDLIHGRNAATQSINVYRETLIGAPPVGPDTGLLRYVSPSTLSADDRKAISAYTCVNGSCHAAAPVTANGYTAPKKHAYTTNITLNDAAAPPGNDQGCLECHGTHGSTDGTSLLVGTTKIQPLGAFLTIAGAHSGGVINAAPGNCDGCHLHADPTGAWQASNSCKNCHGQPPAGTTTTAEEYGTFNESVTPHQLHAGTTGYSFGCKACHGDTLANGTHNTAGKTYQSLTFSEFLDAQGAKLNPVTSGQVVYEADRIVLG